jgi:GAF domain-containing protein
MTSERPTLPVPPGSLTTGSAVDVQNELACLRAALGAAELEYQRAIAENDELRRSLRQQRDQRATMERMLTETASLAALYVTSYRLLECIERDELLTVLQEAIISLVGSESFVVFDVGEGERLEVVAQVGLEPRQIEAAQARPPLVARCLKSCDLYMSDADAEEPAAVIPLCRGGVAEGLVVIFSLLPHKPSFLASDRELLSMLSTHVATAMHRAALHAQAAPS